MTTTRIPFLNVSHQNQNEKINEKGIEKGKSDSSVVNNSSKQNDVEKVKQSLEENIEIMDKAQLIQQLKLHKQILKHCFDENDQLRERVANVEAQFSALQDEIEIRDTTILELSELLEKLNN